MVSHDPAKSSSMPLTWLPPCQAGQAPACQAARTWRLASGHGLMKTSTGPPSCPKPDSPPHSGFPCPEEGPALASAPPFLPSALSARTGDWGPRPPFPTAPRWVPVIKWLYLSARFCFL